MSNDFLHDAAKVLNSPKRHAEICARQINAYWANKGFDAKAYVREAEQVNGQVVYQIASKLVNGVPPREKKYAR